MPDNYVKRILQANVYEVAQETPLEEMTFLSQELKNRILVKREDLQPIFSFKLRGAYNRISRLRSEQKKRGIVAASAGNHAQGVAIAARRLAIQASIIMPRTTPAIKVRSVKAIGGRYVTVSLEGDRFDDACRHALELATRDNLYFVHPYDDPEVIAGQGTIGMEILRQWSGPLHAIFVPVGGGGLIAGISAYVKYLRPETRIVGVEAQDSACLQAALKQGRRVVLPRTGIFADGVAVARIGKEPFRIARQCVDDVITVSTDEICAAIKLMFDDTRSIAEPAGALALAGLLAYTKRRRPRGRTLLTINSGANINFDRLRYVSERYGVGLETEALLCVTIPERPGTMMSLCEALVGYDISELHYRLEDPEAARVFVGVTVPHGRTSRRHVIRGLRSRGFPVVDLTHNDMAEMHVCHMVGGHSTGANRERVFTFEFPERAGILREFLTVLRGRWSLSLFHYRRHGGTYAHVCVGLQPVEGMEARIEDFLEALGYPYREETQNPAYRLFLKSKGDTE